MLVVAHPGHELRVFGWLNAARPLVQVLTDGAGRGDVGRASASRALIEAAGGRVGGVFTAVRDGELYADLLEARSYGLVAILERLTQEAIEHRIAVLVGDAAEGYNPVHDLCRVLIDAVALLVERRSGRRVLNLSFDLTEWETPTPRGDASVDLVLDPEAHAEKIAAARAYPGLRGDVDLALATLGEDDFRVERFWRSEGAPPPAAPAYEATGEARVRAGRYRRAVRYADHVAPVAEALIRYARTAGGAENKANHPILVNEPT
ncbi:MAG: uncharacterized protein JWO33_2771 [Caulobacteraceae bacterium]|nr:uncharacterized protein [Caulobacteraceae bacterium]